MCVPPVPDQEQDHQRGGALHRGPGENTDLRILVSYWTILAGILYRVQQDQGGCRSFQAIML